ncbi:GHKL domain-containing protein, partial [Mediterraneibacter gnavus]
LKKDKKIALFYSLYLFLAYESVRFFFASVFYRMISTKDMPIFCSEGLDLLLTVFCLLIATLIFKYIRLDKELLESKYFSVSINYALWIFFVLSVLRITSSVLTKIKNPFIYEFDTTVSLFIFISYLLTVLYLHEKQISYFHQENIKQKEQENRDLNELVIELGSLYEEIRGFRHDFGGIIACLEPAIEKQNINEIKHIYQHVCLKMNQRLIKADYTAFNLKQIEDIAFRNVLTQKMLQAKAQKIPFYLEVSNNIPIVEVPMLDTVRLLSILLDNALEGTEKALYPQITVAIIHDTTTTSVLIQNTRESVVIDKRKIWEKGYSTKGKNRGIGLSSLLDLIYKLENVDIETIIEEESFTQKLIFRKRGAY